MLAYLLSPSRGVRHVEPLPLWVCALTTVCGFGAAMGVYGRQYLGTGGDAVGALYVWRGRLGTWRAVALHAVDAWRQHGARSEQPPTESSCD